MNVLRKIGYLVQFGCFIHIFNQYVGELTLVGKAL